VCAFGTHGDVAEVLETLFKSREFEASLGAKFKDPMHYVISTMRLAYDGLHKNAEDGKEYWSETTTDLVYQLDIKLPDKVFALEIAADAQDITGLIAREGRAVRLDNVPFSTTKQFVDVAYTFPTPADLRGRTLHATLQRTAGSFVGAQLYVYGGAWVSLGFDSLSSGNVTVVTLAIDAQTGGADNANEAVVRLQHDLFERSYVGAIGTMRAGPNGQGVRRAGGVDIDLPLVVRGTNLEPKFWIAGSQTPGIPGTPLAWRISTDNPNDLFDNFVSLYRIDAGFAPPLGFVRRTGIWETTGHSNFMPRPHAFGIRQLDFKIIPEWDIIANESGSLGRSRDWQTAWFEWRLLGGDRENGDRFEMNVQRWLDAPIDTFGIFRAVKIPPGRYWWSRYELQYFMNPGRPLRFGVFANWGQFYGGRSTDLELSATWRRGGHIIVSTDLIRTTAKLPAGAFTALLSANRFEYDFNTRASLLAFVQFDNASERVDFNVRFHWIPVIGDDVFVVWNSGYTTEPLSRFRFPDTRALARPLNGAFVVKVVHRLAP